MTELELIQNPSAWPQPDKLHLIRNKGEGMLPELGWIFPGSAHVTVGNIFNSASIRTLTYDSIQAILADGWKINK